jgi:hypothetical protein
LKQFYHPCAQERWPVGDHPFYPWLKQSSVLKVGPRGEKQLGLRQEMIRQHTLNQGGRALRESDRLVEEVKKTLEDGQTLCTSSESR